MDKLQPDITFDDSEVEDQQPEQQAETEGQETDSASATDDTAKEQAVEFTPEQQKKFNREIGKKVAKIRETERENQRLMRKNQELEQRLPQDQRPVVPPMPDPWALTDEQYRQQAQMRDEALKKQIAYDAQQQQFMQDQHRQRLEEQQRIEFERQESRNRNAELYKKRVLQSGISESELESAGYFVASALGEESPLTDIILAQDDGPLLTIYLGRNPQELDELLQERDPLKAAVKLVTEIKAKAGTLKRKTSTAPDPISTPRNTGAGSRNYGADGATYE
jgi:protein-tyrosine-phosphatase